MKFDKFSELTREALTNTVLEVHEKKQKEAKKKRGRINYYMKPLPTLKTMSLDELQRLLAEMLR
jgi:hypothetical protein